MVLSRGRRLSRIRIVLWDGRKSAEAVSVSYLELKDEAPTVIERPYRNRL
jgi:hypothetical protein